MHVLGGSAARRGGAVFVALLILAFVAAESAQGNPRRCGTVGDVAVKVDKGAIGCNSARSIATRFIAKAGSCGTSMRPACVVGRFHCRVATPGERGLAGYCYRLKNPVPAKRDFSFYKPRFFRVAIALLPA